MECAVDLVLGGGGGPVASGLGDGYEAGWLLDARVRFGPAAESLDPSGEPQLWPVEPIPGRRVWVASGYEAARDVLAERRLVRGVFAGTSEAIWQPVEVPRCDFGTHTNVFFADPPDHGRLRRPMVRALTPSRLAAVAPRLRTIATALLDAVAPRGRAEVVEDFAFPFAVHSMCELLGVPREFADRYLAFPKWSNAVVSASVDDAARRLYQDALRDRYAWIVELVAHKRHRPCDDPLTEWIGALDAGELSMDELTSTIAISLVAGYDSFLGFVTLSLLALWQRPELMADPSAVVAGVGELLRYTSPQTATFPRAAAESFALHGARIEAGDTVMVHLALANRDPRRFARPHRLDPARPTAQDLAFGHGPHGCVGVRLAHMQGQAALGTLLERFPDLAPAVPLDGLDRLDWRPGCTGPIDRLHVLSGLESLPVVFTPAGAQPRVTSGSMP